MAVYCPIKSLPEWKELEAAQPKKAYKLWNKYRGEVPLREYGISEDDVERDKATSWVRNTFGEGKLFYYDYIKQIGNRTLHGYITNGAMNVWKAAEVGAEFHEGYHLMFRTMLSDAQRSLLYAETSREFGKPTDEEVAARKKQFPDIADDEAYNLVLEEKMAEGFRMHMLTEGESSKTIPQKIKQWFSDLFDFIKAMLTDNVTLKQTYSLLKNSKVNYDLLGRKILRNPQTMKSDISPEMHVEGMPSEAVSEIIEGISDMVVEEIQNWKNPNINLILGDNKTAGSVVHGLLTHLYGYKDNREVEGKEIGPIRQAFALEKEYNKYRIAFENTGKPEYQAAMNKAAQAFKEHKAKFNIKLNNFPPIVEGMSERDLNSAKNQRQIRDYIYKVIDNWRGKYEAKTGNVIAKSWRDEIERNLRNYGYIVKSGKVTIVDVDEQDDDLRELDAKEAQEHIHNQQRIESPHSQRLSQSVKIMLRRFPITEVIESAGKKSIVEKKNKIFSNRPKYHDANFVYKQLLELWADIGTFEEMMVKLENFALHRDDYKSIARGIRRMNEQKRSMLFKNFATTINKAHIVIIGNKSKIFDANAATVEQKIIKQWRTNAVQVEGQAFEDSASRALYNKNVLENEEGEDKSTFTVDAQKLEAIKESYKKLSEIRKSRSSQDKQFLPSKNGEPSVTVIALANTLWNLGINLGNKYDIDETIDNLQNLISAGMYVKQKKGGTKKLDGKALFDHIVEESGLFSIINSFVKVENNSKGVPMYGATKENIIPFYDLERSGVKFLGSLAPLFMTGTAESYVNGERKAIFPIQQRTPIDDVIINFKNDVEKNGENAFKLQKTDPFHIRTKEKKNSGYSLIYKHMIMNPEYLSQLKTVSADVIKKVDETEGEAYGNFNAIDHILTRLYHFINNGKEDFFYCAVPTQADRENLEFMLMPRLRGHSNSDLNYKTNSLIFRDMILQDLFRIKQAQDTIDSADSTKAINYHTGKMLGVDGSGKYMQLDSINPKTGERIVQDYMIKGAGVQMKMSDYVQDYVDAKMSGADLTSDLKQFETILAEMITDLNVFYDQAADVMAKKIIESGRYNDVDLSQAKTWGQFKPKETEEALEGLSKEDAAVMRKVLKIKTLIKDFIIHEDIGTAEIIKITRGNRAAFASLDDFTKRQRLLGTPGALLAIRGTLGVKSAEGAEQYGMIPEFNEATFLDPRGNITKFIEDASRGYVERTLAKLKTVVNPKTNTFFTDAEIAFMNGYLPGQFEETDGLSIISIDMYRYIAEGMGEWGKNEIEAFNAYKRRGSIGSIVYQENFVPKGLKAGDPVIIKPLKPYYEDIKSVSGTLLTEIQKNAYFPLVESYTKSFPILDDVRQRMELSGNYAGRNDLQPIHVFNALSTKKSLKTEPYDISKNSEIVNENGVEVERYKAGALEDIQVVRQDSSKLRFPQEIPDPKGTSDVIFNRQAKKNAIANVDPNGVYYYNSGLSNSTGTTGDTMTTIYHNAIEEKIRRDMESVDKEIGLDKFRKAIASLVEGHKVKGRVNISNLKNSEEFINAKLELLKNIRRLLEKQAIERDMSQNYLDALDITIDPDTNIPRFSIPLDYPVFGRKFQSALLSIYNNNVFKQRLSGTEAVQTAALGGFETNETLKFLEIENDSANSEYGVRLAHAEIMVRADVLRNYGLEEGEISLDNIPEELRRIIGYRIPNQDKASMVILKIKAVLPKEYAKAIVVPPQLVKLMGSDFDVDKMFLLFPEVSMQNGVMTKESANYSELKDDPSLVTKLNEKQLNNVFLDTIEAVLSSPIHFSETLSPLDTSVLGDIKQKIVDKLPELEDVPMFTGGMYHTNSAIRNLLGNKLRGRWSNILAGRNVAQHLDINLFDSFAVKIAGETINTNFLTRVNNPFAIYDHMEFTDKIISRYLSAAVDASKNPFHYIINDNEITFPVETLWINFYGDTNLMHHFLNQPIIRDFVNIMSDKYNNNLAMVNNAYRQVAAMYDINIETELEKNYKRIAETTAMPREDLLNFTLPPKVALRNFMKMYAGGRQIVEMFKVITPDSMDGLNRVEAMQAYMERMEKFANPKDGFVDNAPIALYGRNMSESIIEQLLDEESPYGLQRGYYNMISETLGVASILFPMTMSPEFIGFKNTLREVVAPPTNTFTSDQHRDINSAIIFTILSREDSPLRVFFNKPYNDQNYRIGKDRFTLLTQMNKVLKKYPKLAGNEFFVKITEDPDNKSSKTFRSLQFDAQQQYTVTEKDRIINDLTDMLYRPEKFLPRLKKGASKEAVAERKKNAEEIKTIANKLAIHTLIANGFKQTPFNFAELIPPRFLKQPMDRSLEDLEPISISDYLNEQSLKMANGRYFEGEDMIRFLRIFGEMRPGGSNLVQRKNLDETGKPAKEIDINLEEYATTPKALVVRTKTDSDIYILGEVSKDGKVGKYLALGKTTNEGKHVVGGAYLSSKVVGKGRPIDTILEGMTIQLNNTMNQDKNGDITQICML
jgi:hypothetical protein